MAVLQPPSGPSIILPDRCLVGRSRSCDLVLSGRDISGQHAALQWTGADWELHDLGSRNGTFVDDVRLAAGGRVALRAGALLRFGLETPAYRLVDVTAPQLMARGLTSEELRFGDGGYLALPDSEQPEVCVYQDPLGAWICERDGVPATIDDRAVVTTHDGAAWCVHLPRSCPGTWQDDGSALFVANLVLQFAYSRDEEHVELVAVCGDRRLDLQARAHHYVLLVLARQRQADERAGVPAAEQGWVPQAKLQKMLGMDENHLNICIHRARTQLGRLGVIDAASLVERRSGARRVRLGVGRLEMQPLAGTSG